jgi:hypothetical protein
LKTNILILAVCAALPGLALNQESWVASYGSNGNSCTQSAPCATFQGALGATSAGGIVRAIDTADYGPVRITQSVTIDGNGTGASIAVANADAIDINPGVSGGVVIRNLVLAGVGGPTGIFAQSSAVIENVSINGNWSDGIVCYAVSAGVTCNLRNVSIIGSQFGVIVQGASLSVRDSLVQGNNTGIYVVSNGASLPGAALVERSEISFNTVAGIYVDGTVGPALVRYSYCVVTGNATGIQTVNGGQIITDRTNMLAGNTSDGVTPFSISAK